MARKRYSDEDILKLLREIEVHIHGGTEAVEKALKDGEFQTVIGNLTFNDKGDIEQPAYVFYEWSKGAYSEM